MTDHNNQGQKIRLHKNERHSATQIDSGALPIVPVNTGQNYYTPIVNALPRIYNLEIQSPKPALLAVKITGASLQKLFNGVYDPVSGANYMEPDFAGIGLWFDKRTETGSLTVDLYFATSAGPYNKYRFADTLEIDVTDIDKTEEILFRLQTYRVAIPGAEIVNAVILVIRPSVGYQEEHPIKLGTQAQSPGDFSLITVQEDATTITELSTYPNITPMIRLYPSIERAVRLSDPEGNAVKPNCPFDIMLYDEATISAHDSVARGTRRLERSESGNTGAPRGGRIKRIKIDLLTEFDAPSMVTLRLKRAESGILGAGALEKVHELFVGSIIQPIGSFVAAMTAPYFEYHGAYLSKLGAQVGMLMKNLATGQRTQIYRIEEGLELIAGVLTPVTRIWGQQSTNAGADPILGSSIWNVTDQAQFFIWGLEAGNPTFEWLVDIPYFIQWTTSPNYFIPYEIYAMDPGATDLELYYRLIVHVEENNILTRVNPSRSVAGSEDLTWKW
jgi:hypothetical protein